MLALFNDDAGNGYPFHLRAQVTIFHPEVYCIFLQDGDSGIFAILANPKESARAGDWVEVEGVTARGGFAPILSLTKIKVIEARPFPTPVIVGKDSRKIPESGNLWALARGRVLRQEYKIGSTQTSITVQVRLEGGAKLPVVVADGSSCDRNQLVDAEVIVRGVLGMVPGGSEDRRWDSMYASSCRDFEITRAPHEDWSLPVLRVTDLLTYKSGTRVDDTVHVRGAITFVES